MSTLVLHRKEELQQTMKQAQLRVRLISPAMARARTLAQRLRATGLAVEVFRSSEDGALDLDRDRIDAFIYLAGSSKDLSDIRRVHACRQQKALVPFIVLASAQLASECLEAGADDVVAPSIELPALEKRIRDGMRKRLTNSKITRIFDLEIDSDARSVSRSGQVIQLTRREFAILEILASNRGKVVTRVMIWQRIYNETERYASNVVDVYISYLRQKIDSSFSPALIQTVWGRGYMMRGETDD